MNIDEIKLTLQAEFEYLLPSFIGDLRRYRSRDLDAQTLASNLQEYAVVEAVGKLNGQAFDIERTLAGPILKRESASVKLLYNLIGLPEGVVPPRYEVSEFSKALAEVWSKLNFQNARFSGNPLAVIGADGTLEGELVNTLCIRLREKIRQKDFKSAVDARKREYSQRLSSSVRYFKRHADNCPDLFAYRLDIEYTPVSADGITVEESERHRKNFIEALAADFIPGSLAGYWWKRSYLSEVGYRHHLILLIDSRVSPFNQELVNLIIHRWHFVTEGKGTCTNYMYGSGHCRSLGVGPVKNSWQNNLEDLLSSVKAMLAGDIYLRLREFHGIAHLGMGELPKQVARTIGANFVPQPSRFFPNGWTSSGI